MFKMDEKGFNLIQGMYAIQSRLEWVLDSYMPEIDILREQHLHGKARAVSGESEQLLEHGVITEEEVEYGSLDEPAGIFSNMLQKIERLFACVEHVCRQYDELCEQYGEPEKDRDAFYNDYIAALVYGFTDVIEEKQFYEQRGYTFETQLVDKFFTRDQINQLTEDRTRIIEMIEEYEASQDDGPGLDEI